MTKIKEVELDREVVKVYEWRKSWLTHGGYTKRNANILAGTDIDWRYANQVLRNAKSKGYDQDFVMELIQ